MKKIEEKPIPITNLRPYPANGYKPNPKAVSALAEDIRDNGIRVSLTVNPIPEEPGSYWVVSGNLRLGACQVAGTKEVPCIVKEYRDKDELMHDLLAHNIGRVKSAFDKAWEMTQMKERIGNRAGKRTDLNNDPKGKTNEIIAAELPEKISGDTVGCYINVYEVLPCLFDLVDNRVLSISAADSLAEVVKQLCFDYGEEVSEQNLRTVADKLYFQVEGEEFDDTQYNDEQIGKVIKKYLPFYRNSKKPAKKQEASGQTSEAVEQTPKVSNNKVVSVKAKKDSDQQVTDNQEEAHEAESVQDAKIEEAPRSRVIEEDNWELYMRNLTTGEIKPFTCGNSDCPCRLKQ